MRNFIPALHFDTDKLTSEWAMKVVNYHVYNSNNISLLNKKDVKEIDAYSSGEIDMTPFKKMFTSIKKAIKNAGVGADGNISETLINIADKTGLSWTTLPLIPQKLNSAVETVQKIPIEAEAKAMDGLAMKKREEDIEFLKNKPLIEEDLQDIADQMQLGKVEIGNTKHSSKKFSETPMGLDLNDPDEANVFAQLLYSLNVESANEKALNQFYHLKKGNQVKRLEIIDQFKYGVSSNMVFTNSMTSLPDLEYVYPGEIETPPSRLPDYSDNTHRIIRRQLTVMEMFNYFSEEICDLSKLEEIINGNKKGYCDCNKRSSVDAKQWSTFKVNFKLIEVGLPKHPRLFGGKKG